MWSLTLRDLAYRRRQFAIAIVGSALVFSVALSLTGMSAGFRSEARATATSVGATKWIVPRGVEGPFTSLSVLDMQLADSVAALPGTIEAEPIVVFQTIARVGGRSLGISLVGFVPGRLGAPRGATGAPVGGPGEAIVDSSLGAANGKPFSVGAHQFKVVGTVHGTTILAGVPVVYVPLTDAQTIAFNGRPVASAIITRGTPQSVPSGFRALSTDDVRRDMLRPMKHPTQTIDNTRLLMWVVAGVIIGMVTYLAGLDRMRDFAVLKAVGASSRVLGASLSVEAVLASLLAAGLAAILANILRPLFSIPVKLTGSAYLFLPLIAAMIGVLASLLALRRAIRVDPALAFGA